MSVADETILMREVGHSKAGKASLKWRNRSGELHVRLFGDWQVRQIKRIAKEIKKMRFQMAEFSSSQAELNISDLTGLDTAGAMLILDLTEYLKAQGFEAKITGARNQDQILFDLISRHPREKSSAIPRTSMVLDLVRDLGATIVSIGRDIIELTSMIGQVSISLFGMILRPWRIPFTPLIHHMEHAGLKAVSIISLICFLIGAVITQQGIEQLREYSAEQFSIDMLGILALREVGVLLTSIMIAGRSGAAFTAEIGSMKMREEIDAMRALGINPISTLVVPRVLALMIVLPLLTFIGDIMCLAGGALIGWQMLNLDLISFAERLKDGVEIRHFYVGLIKTPFVAVIIGIVGTLEGMRVRGSAESLGTHVRASVVKSIFLVIILDAMFAMALTSVGI